MSNVKVPRVGVGVVVTHSECVLLGKRRNAHGRGTWSLPGGHLEFGESWEDCAQREVLEETGMVIKDCRFIAATNDIMLNEGLHYVTLFMRAESNEGTPRVCEPDKCERWDWFRWDVLPEPLFAPLATLLSSIDSRALVTKYPQSERKL